MQQVVHTCRTNVRGSEEKERTVAWGPCFRVVGACWGSVAMGRQQGQNYATERARQPLETNTSSSSRYLLQHKSPKENQKHKLLHWSSRSFLQQNDHITLYILELKCHLFTNMNYKEPWVSVCKFSCDKYTCLYSRDTGCLIHYGLTDGGF